jgi:hypothetical protein
MLKEHGLRVLENRVLRKIFGERHMMRSFASCTPLRMQPDSLSQKGLDGQGEKRTTQAFDLKTLRKTIIRKTQTELNLR